MMTDKTKLLFQVSAEDFKKIPGSPIAYRASNAIYRAFDQYPLLNSVAYIKKGLFTGNNDLFFRKWFEIIYNKIDFKTTSAADVITGHYIPINNGGTFRRWYGNRLDIIKFDKYHYDLIQKNKGHRSPQFYFKKSAAWTKTTSGIFSIRLVEEGFINTDASMSVFEKKVPIEAILGLLNTKVSQSILDLLNESRNYTSGDVASIPYSLSNLQIEQTLPLVFSCVKMSQNDWDSYETSWDFQENPLVDTHRHNDKPKMLSDLYGQVRASWEQQCETMRKLEVENNQIFIEIYGLQDELSPDVPWNEITLTCNPWYRYGKSPELESDGQHFSTTGEQKVGTIFGMQPTGIKVSEPNPEMKVTSFPFNQELEDRLQKDTVKELISYAVGCMFGRYSLDVPGLAFAGGEWESTNYMTFLPDADNVIPILDEDWFADDIVGRFQEFLKVAFGEENYHENLAFVEAALGKDIRSYFTKDFYADHMKMYQKRPIYWLFSSPTGAFSALVYLHRYRPDTVGTVLTYLRSHITKVNAHIQEQEEIIASAKASASMKSKAVRERLKMQHELQELEDYERDVLYPLSTERLEIDLDDGVKVNYPKFGKALRPVKGLDAKEE